MRTLPTLFLILATTQLVGCATAVTPAGYYWGKYSQTLYGYTKTPSDEALAAHIMELEKIVEESRKRDLKVPPGIHAELGYYKAQRGEDAAAMAHYQSEMELYPESRFFLERLIGPADGEGV